MTQLQTPLCRLICLGGARLHTKDLQEGDVKEEGSIFRYVA